MLNKENIKQLPILNDDFVRVIPTLNNVDIRYAKRSENNTIQRKEQTSFPTIEKVKRIDKDTYLDPITNKEKKYKHNTERTQNELTFYRTRRELNWLILNNFAGGNQEIFLTLTYTDMLLNTTVLSTDFRNYMKRVGNQLKGNCSFEYIVIKEPHLSGSWHMHVLLRCNKEITTEIKLILENKWKNGAIHTQAITQVNKLAAYLTSHLTNLIIDSDGVDSITIDYSTMTTKNIIKNARLGLYPMQFRIYSSSKNIKKPLKRYMTFAECKHLYQVSHFKNYDASFKLFNKQFALIQRHIQLTKKSDIVL